MDNKALVDLIGLDGGLRHVPEYLVPELKKKGWKVIHNAKRTYFPELDQTSPYYRAEEKEIDESNFILKVEVI